MMTKEGSSKIVNFMTPGAGVLLLGHGHLSHIVKMHYFFKISFSLLSQALICSIDDYGRVYQNCKFHIGHYSEYVLSSCLSICCFPIQLLIFIYYYNGGVDMQICTPLTRSQCKVSDTQVKVRPVGLLFNVV